MPQVRTTPEAATGKWTRNIGAATAEITSGVQGVQTAPGMAAAAQKQKWLQRVTASVDKWASRTASVSLNDWQQSMITIGIPRIAQGAQAKQGKYQSFAAQFFPFLQTGMNKVHAMPSTTLEDNINRAVTMIRHNATFKRTGSSGA